MFGTLIYGHSFTLVFPPSQHQKVIVLTYLYDVFLLGTIKKVLTALSDLSSSLAVIELKVVETSVKSTAPLSWFFKQFQPQTQFLLYKLEGTIIPKTLLGEGSLVKKSCYRFADSGCSLFVSNFLALKTVRMQCCC